MCRKHIILKFEDDRKPERIGFKSTDTPIVIEAALIFPVLVLIAIQTLSSRFRELLQFCFGDAGFEVIGDFLFPVRFAVVDIGFVATCRQKKQRYDTQAFIHRLFPKLRSTT